MGHAMVVMSATITVLLSFTVLIALFGPGPWLLALHAGPLRCCSIFVLRFSGNCVCTSRCCILTCVITYLDVMTAVLMSRRTQELTTSIRLRELLLTAPGN